LVKSCANKRYLTGRAGRVEKPGDRWSANALRLPETLRRGHVPRRHAVALDRMAARQSDMTWRD
jgi:hypothetical protein